MSTEMGQLVYTLRLDDANFTGELQSSKEKVAESSSGMTSSLKGTEEATGGLKNAFSSMAGQFVIGQAVFTVAQKALDGIKGIIDGGIQAAKEWQTQQAGLQSELKSTSDAVGLTAEQIRSLAEETENKTAIDKAAVLTGQNMLLTFTNIGKDAFPIATQAMVDMATRMNGGLIPNGQMLSNTAIQLGKALNDPITGLNALHRVGVTFTDQQKEQITTLQQNGNMLGAQKIILNELGREFGGSAAANMKTFTGQWAAFTNNLQDTVGTILNALIPVLEKIGSWLLDNKPVLAGLIGVIIGLSIAIGVALVQALWALVAPAVAAVIAMWPIVAAGAAIGFVAYEIISNWSSISAFFADVWSGIAATFAPVIDYFVTMFQGAWNGIVNIFNGAKSYFTGVWNGIVGVFTSIGTAIGNAIGGAFRSVINAVVGGAVGIINGFIGAIDTVIDVVNHIPGVHLGKLTPLSAPKFATGTNNYPGGWGVMNENGGELVKLPSGSQIIPADKTNKMLGGSTNYNFSAGSVILSTAEAVDEFFNIGNRNTQLEGLGIAPLAGTTGIG